MDNQNNGTQIPVLSAKNNNRKKKKIMEFLPVIAIVAVLVIAVIITAAIVKSKKSDKEKTQEVVTESSGDLLVPSQKEKENENEADTTPVTFMEDVEISFEGISSDFADMLTTHAMNASSTVAIKPEFSKPGSNSAPKPEKPAKPHITTKEHLEKTTVVTDENTNSSKKVTDTITSFFNRTYYFDGEMISDGEKMPLEIAMNKSDFQLFTEMEDKDISLMSLDGKIYMLNPSTKKYTEFSASVQKMMGIDASQFTFEFNNANFDGRNPDSITKAKYNNQDAICYTYKNAQIHMDFICVDDEIRQMTMFDADGNAKNVLIADEFVADIPDEMLNFKGYSKTNIISFMSSLM